MSRIAAAIAFACTIVLVSDPSYARPRFRLLSSTPKPAAVTPKPVATAPAADRNRNGSLFISTGSRPAAITSDAQRAVDAPAKGPLQYDPDLASADAKPPVTAADDKAPALLKEIAAAPSGECAVAKEPAPAKENETVAAEPAKADPVRSRAAFLVPVVNKHKRGFAPQVATVCYVQRDGSCTPH